MKYLNIITHNIDICLIKNSYFPPERCKCIFNLSNICIFIIPGTPLRKVDGNEILNQILQIESDDENLNLMRNEPHYLEH